MTEFEQRQNRPRYELIDPGLFSVREIRYPIGRNGCVKELLRKANKKSDNLISYLQTIINKFPYVGL